MDSRVERQQQIANIVMDTVQRITIDSIIAGGAPREWYFNKPATDIDIFFYLENLRTIKSVEDVIDLFQVKGLQITKMVHAEISENYANPDIEDVFEGVYFDEKFQFILCNKPPVEVVHNFPVNMSRIWYKYGKFHPFKTFIIGAENKALIQMSEGYGNREKYMYKIIDKFPGYKFYSSWEFFVEATGVKDVRKR